MTEDELSAIEARANAADIGPWTHQDGMISWPAPGTSCGSTITDGVHEHDHECEVVDSFRSFTRTENGDFIAHARADVPALIEEVRRLRERPNVVPCECGHPWDNHNLSGTMGAPRGGCGECNCEHVVGVIKVGQSYSTIVTL